MSILDSQVADGTIKFVPLATTADGDNTVVAAVAGKKIRVVSYAFTASAAGTVIFKDSGTTYATFTLSLNAGVSFQGNPMSAAFETTAGLALVVNNGTGVDTNGHLAYVLA